MHSHKPPKLMSRSAAAGMLATSITAPGQLVTVRAIQAMAAMPAPIGWSASASRCSGISSTDRIAHGITQKPVIGTATAFARTE